MENEKTYDTQKKDILIFDWRIGRVLEFLEDNEFTHKPHRAYKYGCTNWVFVNLGNMTYTRGVGGIQTGKPLKNHAITFGEFKYILDVFHSERFDLEKEEVCLEPNPRKKYINMHRDLIKDEY